MDHVLHKRLLTIQGKHENLEKMLQTDFEMLCSHQNTLRAWEMMDLAEEFKALQHMREDVLKDSQRTTTH